MRMCKELPRSLRRSCFRRIKKKVREAVQNDEASKNKKPKKDDEDVQGTAQKLEKELLQEDQEEDEGSEEKQEEVSQQKEELFYKLRRLLQSWMLRQRSLGSRGRRRIVPRVQLPMQERREVPPLRRVLQDRVRGIT